MTNPHALANAASVHAAEGGSGVGARHDIAAQVKFESKIEAKLKQN